MSALKDQLQSDLTTAIKARDEVTSATIRMALTAITNEEVAGKEARALSDDDVLTVLGREAKKRRESATAYDDAGRPGGCGSQQDPGGGAHASWSHGSRGSAITGERMPP